MTVIRLLVTGGRHYSDTARLNRILDSVHHKHAIEVLIHGACHLGGADMLADAWAKSRGVPVEAYPVSPCDGVWPGAGPARNRRMIDASKATHGIAFPGGDGTTDCVRAMRRAGLLVWVLEV